MRKYSSIPLSTMTDGVNRFEAEAKQNQTIDALNVINDDGYLRRRDALTSIAAGAPHYLPAGQTFVIVSNESGTLAERRPSYGLFSGSGVKSIFIGCPEKFDGISWGRITALPGSITQSISLTFGFSTTTTVGAGVEKSKIVDMTRRRMGNYMASLCQDGHISWHRDEIEGWTARPPSAVWDSTTYNADYLGDITDLYWVKLSLVKSSDGTAVTMDNTLTLSSPGIRAFQLQPVNGLFPVRIADRQVTVVCNDRSRTGGSSSVRPNEPGSQIGIIRNSAEQTDVMRLVEDEGVGIYSQIEWPVWNDPTTGFGSPFLGTSLKLRKSDQSYDWLNDSGGGEPQFGQFRGSPIHKELAVQSGGNPRIIKLLKSAVEPEAYEFDHCRLRLTDCSGSALTVGEEREIWYAYSSGSYTYLLVYGDFAGTPTTGDKVAIISPHARVAVSGLTSSRPGDFEMATHSTSSTHEIGLLASSAYAADPSSFPDVLNKHVNFEVSREGRWVLDGGERYSGTYNKSTKKLIITNGKSPLMEIDGERLRVLSADTTSETALTISGEMREADLEAGESEFSLRAKTYLRSQPPLGDFVVDYRGRIVVGRKETNEIIYNWPGKPDIWPVGYIFLLRDSENNPITGMSTLHDRLIVYTATAIFECDVGPSGYFTVRPASQGIGFTSHWAVERISSGGTSALIGPGTDGVYLYTGAEPVVVLDDWSRLLEGGVNRGRLNDAVAGVSFTKNLYFLAVAAAGSEKNNRILVFDFARKNWWVWGVSNGISSIATDYDESGAERVLFGTNDGHVRVLQNAPTDDGEVFSSHARTPPVSPFGDREASFIATLGAYGDLGQRLVGTLPELNVFTEERAAANETISFYPGLDAGRGSADATDWSDNKSWGDGRFIRRRINLPLGTKGNTFSAEISDTSGTRWRMRDITLMARKLGRRGR